MQADRGYFDDHGFLFLRVSNQESKEMEKSKGRNHMANPLWWSGFAWRSPVFSGVSPK